MKTKHLPGNRYGRLTLVRRIPGTRTRAARAELACDCGVTIVRRIKDVAEGLISSCGCLRRELARERDPLRPYRFRRKDHTGYEGAHTRVRRERGPASAHRCVDCGKPARHWSLDYASEPAHRTMLYAGPEGTYANDPAAYAPRCVRCHRLHDAAYAARARAIGWKQ